MSIPVPQGGDADRFLRVLSLNVWGLAFVSMDRPPRIAAIAAYLASSDYDIVCLQELWIYKDYEIVKQEVQKVLPFSRFFHTGALGSGLAIFTRFPLISAQALPYALSGSPAEVIAGDFFVNKAAGNVVILHPLLGEIEIWDTHMHAGGDGPPETNQAHRIAQAWQLANQIRSGAAKGRYILCMGDFNSQPWSIPINILRKHATMRDSFIDANPSAEDPPSSIEAEAALRISGMTCDSTLNTWSAAKNIPGDVAARGGKRLDYIFYREPEVARRRPLIWGYRDEPEHASAAGGVNSDAAGVEEGKPLPSSVQHAPTMRCVRSEVVLTELVPGHQFSYSDHFGLFSTFQIDAPATTKRSSGLRNSWSSRNPSTSPPSGGSTGQNSFTPLLPMMSEPEPLSATTTTFARPDPPKDYGPDSPRPSASLTAKSTVVRTALDVLRMYTKVSQSRSRGHLRWFGAAVVCLVGLTIGSAWQPKSWIQPIFTLLAGALGAGGATYLYWGFLWGRWEMGLLTEAIEEMELELRVVEMEERISRF